MSRQEYFRENAIEYVGDIFKLQTPKKVFFVTGDKSYHNSGAKQSFENLLDHYALTHFKVSTSCLKLDDILEGLRMFENDCDLVIAVGGGSVIDTAKLINIFSAQSREPIEYLMKNRKVDKNGKPLIAVPTTAGSGSEATHFAVVYVNGVKYSLAHDFLLPTYAIIDPKLAMSMPKNIAANSGMDAFCQAIESYWSINSTEESKSYSERAIKLVLENFVESVNSPSLNSRKAMMQAANLAGKAINIAKTTAPHALSYDITSRFGVPHGQAVALTVGSILEYNAEVTDEDCNDERGVSYVVNTLHGLCSLLGCFNHNEVRRMIEDIIKNVGLETELETLGISEERLNEIVDNVNYERLKNNPRNLSDKDILKTLLSD